MKHIKKLPLGLALASLALASLTFTQPALAADYTGDCASVPASVSGNVDINESGACNITHPVTATGRIKITAGAAINTQDLNSFAEVDLQAPASSNITVSGSITTNSGFVNLFGNNITVTGTINPVNLGNVLLRAQSNLVTGQIIGAPGSNIDLKANQSGAANTLFTIGGSGNTNGVNGTITAKPAGYDPYFAPAIVHVVNGTASSTGGITLTNPANIITTPQPGSRAAYVFLNARNGTLTIPTGTLSANGGTSDGAGLIALMAKTIAFGANATVSASQSSTAAGTLHGVLISAEKVTYQGTSGLNLTGSGNGADLYNTGYVQVFPQGVVTISDTETPFNLVIYAVIGTNQAGNVTFQGAGTAPLNVTADGNNTLIAFTGTTLTFTGGAVKMKAWGATNHKIRLQNPGTLTGANVGLTFSGTGAVTLDALGVAGAGGDIELFLDKANFNKPTYTFTANGPTASSGNGGTVYVGSQLLTLSPTSKFTIAANASSFSTGDAIASDPANGDPKAIRFFPGATSLNIGTASGLGQISFSAKGGKSGGKGGTIVISSSPVSIKTANAINASAVGGNGDGGEIFLYSFVQGIDPSATMTAIGKGTGKGGRITFSHNVNLVSSNLDVTKTLQITGGNSVPVANFNGSLKLNGVLCQQWKSSTYPAWPKSYWKCVEPTVQQGLYYAPVEIAQQLNTNLRSELLSKQNSLFVFQSLSNYETFYRNYFSDGRKGNTDYYGSPITSSISNVFPPNATTESLKEVAAHELAHPLDIWSSSAGYQASAIKDFFVLDYLSDQGTPQASPRRHPCIPDGATPAPFVNTFNEVTGQPVCNGGVLDPAYTTGGVAWRNSQIAFNVSTKIGATDELYTQQFAIELYAKTIPAASRLNKVIDILVPDNGFLSCTKQWAVVRVAGSSSAPTLGSQCSAAPAWYDPNNFNQ